MRRGDIIIRLQVRNSVLEEAGQDYEEKMKARHKALSSCSFILAAEFYCLFINSCQDETGTAPVFARQLNTREPHTGLKMFWLKGERDYT